MICAPDDPDFYDDEDTYDESDDIGCYECNSGWKHGCMDDLCRGGNDASECHDAIACRACNPTGEA